MNSKQKYLKYKSRYIELKQFGGLHAIVPGMEKLNLENSPEKQRIRENEERRLHDNMRRGFPLPFVVPVKPMYAQVLVPYNLMPTGPYDAIVNPFRNENGQIVYGMYVNRFLTPFQDAVGDFIYIEDQRLRDTTAYEKRKGYPLPVVVPVVPGYVPVPHSVMPLGPDDVIVNPFRNENGQMVYGMYVNRFLTPFEDAVGHLIHIKDEKLRSIYEFERSENRPFVPFMRMGHLVDHPVRRIPWQDHVDENGDLDM